MGAFAFASVTNANIYAEGDIGLSQTKANGSNNTRVGPRVSVGYKVGNTRVAGDYTHHGKVDGTKIQGLGASVLYDFDTNSKVQPYVGARVATNQFKYTNRAEQKFKSSSDIKLGYGVVAGAKYKLDGNWYANGGVEYNRLGNFDSTKVNNYGAKVGVGYGF